MEWIEFVLRNPFLVNKISIIESHYFSIIKENEDRCLKVAVNPNMGTVITAYFDRNMRKKGCK